jgi:hypothetical protein
MVPLRSVVFVGAGFDRLDRRCGVVRWFGSVVRFVGTGFDGSTGGIPWCWWFGSVLLGFDWLNRRYSVVRIGGGGFDGLNRR